jgi:hypothetical protein
MQGAPTGSQFGENWMGDGIDPRGGWGDAGGTHEVLHVAYLLAGHQGDDRAGVAGTCGATGAV